MLRRDFDDIYGGVGRGPRMNWLPFGGDLEHDTDLGFLTEYSL